VKKFKTDPAVKYLCCTDALAFGVDFPEIDFLVSLDLNPDLATMLQRPERIYRITSTRPKTVVAFYSSGIEEDIYEILKGKAALVEQITEGKAADKSVNIKAEIGRKYGLVSRREEN
jgi:superfamily II DNA/RNA helicase